MASSGGPLSGVPSAGTYYNPTTTYPPTVPQPHSTHVNLQVDPQVLMVLQRIAVALETIVEKMGHGFD